MIEATAPPFAPTWLAAALLFPWLATALLLLLLPRSLEAPRPLVRGHMEARGWPPRPCPSPPLPAPPY